MTTEGPCPVAQACAASKGDKNTGALELPDIDDTFLTGIGQPKRISVDFSERLCVPNNSIWVLSQSSIRDDKVDYRYINADGTQWIRLEGDRDIGATYARDHAGLRVLRCR